MASTKFLFGYFVILLFFLFASTQDVVASSNVSNTLCIKEERMALFKIKKRSQ
jgi:hypothetical protein